MTFIAYFLHPYSMQRYRRIEELPYLRALSLFLCVCVCVCLSLFLPPSLPPCMFPYTVSRVLMYPVLYIVHTSPIEYTMAYLYSNIATLHLQHICYSQLSLSGFHTGGGGGGDGKGGISPQAACSPPPKG